MTSPEAMKANVQNGFPVAPRFSVSADPEARSERRFRAPGRSGMFISAIFLRAQSPAPL